MFKYDRRLGNSMKRRVIKQGNNSYTLTLPVDWVRELDLKEGSEVDVSEDEGKLVVVPDQGKVLKEISIELDDSYEKNVRFALNQLYRKGYDRINVTVHDVNSIALIQNLMEELFFEMDVIEKKGKSCVLEMMSQPSMDNYASILKKLIYIIHDSMELIHTSVKTKKLAQMDDIDGMTRKYRKYDNFCRRFVNVHKKGIENLETNSILIHLLMIQTDLRRFPRYAKKVSAADLALFEEVKKFYISTYTAFFNKNLKALYDNNKKINDFLNKRRSVALTKGMTLWSSQCLQVLRILYSVLVAMIGLTIEIRRTDN